MAFPTWEQMKPETRERITRERMAARDARDLDLWGRLKDGAAKNPDIYGDLLRDLEVDLRERGLIPA